MMKSVLGVVLFASALTLFSTLQAEELKPRIVVLTDIAPNDVEPDDMESTIRLLAHADLFEIEALVATTGWSNTGGKERIDLIHDALNAYEKDLPNLLKRSSQTGHRADESRQEIGYWPSLDYLRSRTVLGSVKMGQRFVGEGNDSEGSNLIVKLAAEDDERPIWVCVWGGGNTVAQAIWRVQKDRTPEQLQAFLKKIRVYTITDQDKPWGTQVDFAISSHQWMRREFKDDLLFIWDESAWLFQNDTGKSNWDKYAEQIQGHGALGALYPKYKWGVEGDTPSFLYVWPNGLNDPEHPGFGGWGGYFEMMTGPDKQTVAFTNFEDTHASAVSRKYETRFYPAIFNNFAARMDWAANGTGNRNPVAVVNGDQSLKMLTLKPKAGASVKLEASASSDPDGDALIFSWWVLTEAGTYTQAIEIEGKDSNTATVKVPVAAAGKSFHVVCEVTDNGTPALTSYRRIVFEPEASAEVVQSVDAKHVRLLPGSAFYDRQELHRTTYLASYEPDRLLYDYRRQAGVPQPEGVVAVGTGWDTSWLRGHMMGHYLSAASRMAAATGDETYREKVDYMVEALAECQKAMGQEGYLAAFPSGAFDRLEGKPGDGGGVVVPYYIVHKTMAGLLDAYHYLGNKQALEIAIKMGDYFSKRLDAVDSAQLDKMFRTDGSRNPQNEFGAMNDVLAELYEVTGDEKYLKTARLFNRPWFMEPLAKGEDHLEGLHANTHVAQAVGLAHCANLSSDPTELKASATFWKMVTQDHLFVIGGNSFNEWFDEPGVEVGPSINDEKMLPPTTAETCNTHNMLKLTSYLFEREQKAEYADFCERALYNHLLASVASDTGAVTYFTPMHGHFRTYLDGTHCCVGSGIENTPRFNENIYFQDGRSLWVNLFIPSELDWEETGMVLRQEGDITKGEKITFTVVEARKECTLYFRVPQWVAGPATLTLNGEVVESEGAAASYLTLKRQWKQSDVITLNLPAALRIEVADDDPSMVSIFYGPVLLAGELGNENMPNDFADKDAHLKLAPANVPDIVSQSIDPWDWLEPIGGPTPAFRMRNAGPADGIVFRPLYEVHHQRYSVYWKLGSDE